MILTKLVTKLIKYFSEIEKIKKEEKIRAIPEDILALQGNSFSLGQKEQKHFEDEVIAQDLN